jgi:hypothetical protein
MTSFSKQLSFRWSDLDPNFHVRHSVLRLGAQHRIEILESLGLTMKVTDRSLWSDTLQGRMYFQKRNRAF